MTTHQSRTFANGVLEPKDVQFADPASSRQCLARSLAFAGSGK